MERIERDLKDFMVFRNTGDLPPQNYVESIAFNT
jgi:hypothetical protein